MMKLMILWKKNRRWEDRIRKLGGPDYRKMDKIDPDEYQYYGVAKDLPKVREMFGKEKPVDFGKSYEALTKKVGYEYFKEEEDNEELLEEEKRVEEEIRRKIKEEWEKDRGQRAVKRVKIGENEEKIIDEDIDDFVDIHESIANPINSINQTDTPITAEMIRKTLLQKRKQALISKYASEADDANQDQTGNVKINED